MRGTSVKGVLTGAIVASVAYAGICSVTDFKGRGVIGTVCYEVGET